MCVWHCIFGMAFWAFYISPTPILFPSQDMKNKAGRSSKQAPPHKTGRGMSKKESRPALLALLFCMHLTCAWHAIFLPISVKHAVCNSPPTMSAKPSPTWLLPAPPIPCSSCSFSSVVPGRRKEAGDSSKVAGVRTTPIPPYYPPSSVPPSPLLQISLVVRISLHSVSGKFPSSSRHSHPTPTPTTHHLPPTTTHPTPPPHTHTFSTFPHHTTTYTHHMTFKRHFCWCMHILLKAFCFENRLCL